MYIITLSCYCSLAQHAQGVRSNANALTFRVTKPFKGLNCPRGIGHWKGAVHFLCLLIPCLKGEDLNANRYKQDGKVALLGAGG